MLIAHLNSHNCRRAGGSSSVNYVIDPGELQLNDPHASLSTYFDRNTTSGNTITRRFCGSCGSPISTQTPQYPDKIIIKASLFDSMSTPAVEAFIQRREAWMKPIDDAQQK
ncbi:Glutathione-dependent formaldehyde-activating family GFA [Macrophomina phaseolina MS6]|uniref:Glutathione-dependent formaldehyde-activating family GFA n=1 Tax=Macrophomina phaseolina (strain MS6) TaxID=1126212 RepID=K2RN98_MACPH|nr:Glutathione-dependent formaldehyde-activating family GFA [Macrophomina phaseolina MS6]